MKKMLAGFSSLLLLIFGLSGCTTIGEKNASLTIIYSATAVLSLVLLLSYCFAVRKKELWFVVMFSSVLVVNVGYFCLAVSSSLNEALCANSIAYLGSVPLPMAMLMIILNITNTKYKKWLTWCLLGLCAVVLFIVTTPGYLDIYYKEVSFEIINGVSTLVKVYGPLHPLYLFYLLGYFSAMIAVIIRAKAKNTIDSTAHAIIIAISVFVNIGVWFIEQLVKIDFEMLSVSYIISELFLLGVHLVMNENQRLKELIHQKEKAEISGKNAKNNETPLLVEVDDDSVQLFTNGYSTLTPKELELFNDYISGLTTKEILSDLNIKENTLKYHNRNLYSKLGVKSRKQLIAVYQYIQASKETSE